MPHNESGRTAAQPLVPQHHPRGFEGHAGLSQRPGGGGPPGGLHHEQPRGASPHGGGPGGGGGDDQRGLLRQKVPPVRPAGGQHFWGELHLHQGQEPHHRLPGPHRQPGAAAGLWADPPRLQAGVPVPPPDDREHGGTHRGEERGPGGKAGGHLPHHHSGETPHLSGPPGGGRRQPDLHRPHEPHCLGGVPLRRPLRHDPGAGPHEGRGAHRL